MKVVCDSSTLIAFSRINHLWLLRKEATQLTIPEAVYQDVVIKGAGKFGSEEVRKANWIKRRKVQDQERANRLNRVLHHGESEVITLAKEIQADFVIFDDEEARKIAEQEGLKIIGGLSFLVRAKERGWIKAVKPLLDELRAKDFFIGEDLYRDILHQVNEL